MKIENHPLQINNPQLEQILTFAQYEGTDLAENLLKMNALQQIDQSQMSFMGSIIDLFV
ncbi:MAG: hypothetical protein JEY91_15610 [Spirochaetaceae bacterium]|nr:hypothetical protein [Spirochaetaceae bacterium]